MRGYDIMARPRHDQVRAQMDQQEWYQLNAEAAEHLRRHMANAPPVLIDDDLLAALRMLGASEEPAYRLLTFLTD
jgi:hypothetical protein